MTWYDKEKVCTANKDAASNKKPVTLGNKWCKISLYFSESLYSFSNYILNQMKTSYGSIPCHGFQIDSPIYSRHKIESLSAYYDIWEYNWWWLKSNQLWPQLWQIHLTLVNYSEYIPRIVRHVLLIPNRWGWVSEF